MSRYGRYERLPDLSAGACRTPAAVEVFSDIIPATVSAAVAICQGCPSATRAACLEWGVRHEDSGVWGGLDDDGLRTQRRNRGIRLARLSAGEVAPRGKYKRKEVSA